MTSFYLDRIEDESGISGTGRVAEGVVFSDGRCALRWLTKHTSFAFYDSIEEVRAIHGHGGKTRITFEELPLPEAFAYLDKALDLAKAKVVDDYAYAVFEDAHAKFRAALASSPTPGETE